RRVYRCNAVPVGKISSGLPLKSRKEKVLKEKTIQSEQGVRKLIERALRKEVHPGTKSNVDFIKKVLDDTHESGMSYDVTDMRNRIVAFANNSTNQAQAALKVVGQMQWTSTDIRTPKEDASVGEPEAEVSDDRLVFFDVEVYPNLFVVCW